MKTRGTFTVATFAAVALLGTGGPAAAQTYPDRPIKIIVGFPPGQSTDTVARSIGQKMSEDLKQTVYVDNRPGAGGSISHEAVKNALADGYTLLMGSGGTLAINPALYRKLPYDPQKDFEPIALVSGGPLYLYTSATMPVNNLKEMIAYVKARPGKVSYGSGGNGSTANIAMEMLKRTIGIDMLHVPYKGAPAVVTDVVGGQIEFAFEAAPLIVPQAKTGRVKLLAVTSKQRSTIAPEVPTVAEQGFPEFQALTWTALMAPKGTPPAVIDKLNASVNKTLKNAEIIAQTQSSGSSTLGGTAAELQVFLRGEIARWGKAVKDSGAQID